MSTGLKGHVFLHSFHITGTMKWRAFYVSFCLKLRQLCKQQCVDYKSQTKAGATEKSWGGVAWGTSCHSTHSRSLKNFHTLCIPSCPPQIPVFSDSICCGIYHTPFYHWALARPLQRRCIPLDCTKHSWENGWQFQNLVTIARMSTSYIHAPFPPSHPCSWLTCLTHCWPIERPGLSGFGSCLCPCLAQFLSVYACLYPHRPRRHKCLATQNYRQKRW